MPVPPSLIDARDLVRTYAMGGAAAVFAVRGVSIAIGSGEFVALQGPSGSGKTTLLNLLGLLDRPDSGQLAIDGVDAEGLSENARSDMGV